jgi:peptide/nickel transport system permease protein
VKLTLQRWLDGDVAHSFRTSPVAMLAAAIAFACIFAAVFAELVAPHNPFDLATLELSHARLKPSFEAHPLARPEDGSRTYLLGTDDQGRDILSALMYGARISLVVGIVSVLLSMLIGVSLGLLAGLPRRLARRVPHAPVRRDAEFSTHPGGLAHRRRGSRAVSQCAHTVAFGVLILAITLTGWVQYARTVRGSTLVERNKEYVQAARVTGVAPVRIMMHHVLPNVTGPVMVLATVQLATAIITEATLSFLGVGVPPTSPSLGTLIQVGNNYLFSGEWWITVFPALMLILIALSVNLLGDWLRDALNPRLR